jgi:hypothetical protein
MERCEDGTERCADGILLVLGAWCHGILLVVDLSIFVISHDHILAVQMNNGVEELSEKRIYNLTQLRKKYKETTE